MVNHGLDSTPDMGLVTGETVTAALMNAHIRDNLNAGFPDAVTSNDWDPALEATVTDPTLSSVDGAEYQVGALHVCWANFTLSGPGGAGSGTYFVTLPSTATNVTASSSTGSGQSIGQWAARDDTATAGTAGAVLLRSTTTAHFQRADASTVGAITDSSPWAWANADVLSFHAVYPFA